MLNQLRLLCVTILGLNTLATPSFADHAETSADNKGIKIEQGDTKFKIGGRIVLDHDEFDGVHNNGNTGSGTVLRRARLTIQHSLSKKLDGKLMISFDDKNKKINVNDAYIKYKIWDGVEMTIGKSKAVFGMEALASSKYIPTIERSMASDAFAPSRKHGLTLFAQGGGLTAASSVYIEDKTDTNRQTYAWAGRATYAPIHTNSAVIHLGLAGLYRDIGGNDYQIKKTAEVNQANKIVKSGLTVADNAALLALETAIGLGAFTFEAEYMKADVEAEQASDFGDAAYYGYYATIGYFLTGETFSYKKGLFGKPKFRPGHSAWQLVAKFSNLDANDNNQGVEVENITLGVNYYPNSNLRLSANYIMTDVKSSNANLNEYDGEALTFRVQYLF